MLLETGQPQIAAVALYRSSGYVDVERFGHYADSETALNLGRPLTPEARFSAQGRI
jgi:ribosomal protein S18 acetylase RimI-like enzyme